MKRNVRRIATGLFGLFVLVVLPALALNRQRAEELEVDRSSGDWQQVVATSERVDQLIAEFAAENGITLSAPTMDLKILRRLNLVLTGSNPSLEEIRAFQALPETQRLQIWTDRLLVDPRTHDYLAERLARAMVSSLPVEPFFIYRRRRFVSWVSDQLAANVGYDQLARKVLSAEGLWTDQPAANYVTAQEMDASRLANRTARAFLGLRLDCAECHNHPFADWTQKDFRGLAAYFGQCEFGLQGVKDLPEKTFSIEDPTTKVSTVIEPQVPFSEEIVPEQGRLRERLAAWVTAEENPYFAPAITNRIWRLLLGKGLVEPVDDLEAGEAVPGVLDVLAEDFRAHGCDLRHLIRVITQTHVFRSTSALDSGDQTEESEELFAAFPMSRLRPEQLAYSLVQVSSLRTMDYERHLFVRLSALGNRNDFIELYGDFAEEELAARQGNIPQRLLLMNGEVAGNRIKSSPFSAAGRLSSLAPTDEQCVDIAYLVCLCRQPTEEERNYFRDTLKDRTGQDRERAVEDMMWALVNGTEFSWNH